MEHLHLVFLQIGGLLKVCSKFYLRLGELKTSKTDMYINTMMGWLHAKLLFKLLRSINDCIRDSLAQNT